MARTREANDMNQLRQRQTHIPLFPQQARALPKLSVCLCVAILCAAGTSPARAQDSTTASTGGTGGDPYTIGCGSDKVLVGVQGKYGNHFPLSTYVNFIQPICVAVDTGGTWMGNPAAAADTAGKNEGTFASLRCPSGWAVSAIDGLSGTYVDVFGIFCAPLGDFGHLTGQAPIRISGVLGGPGLSGAFGGNGFGPLSCPNSKPAKGFTGKAHDWIDRIALVCNFPTTPRAGVLQMSLNPNSIVGGKSVSGDFTLNASAPAGGTRVSFERQINLADEANFPASLLPAAVTVQAGQKEGSFTVNTKPVVSPVNVTFAALPIAFSARPGDVYRTLKVLPPSLASLSLSSVKVSPGGSVTGTIEITGNAPQGGLAANLTSNAPAVATVPATVDIAAGQSSATFPVSVASGNQSGCAVISASGLFTPAGDSPLREVMLVVAASHNSAFTLSTTNGTSSASSTVKFPGVSSSSRVVNLQSSNPSLISVPASVTVPANSDSAQFTINVQGRPPTGLNCAAVSATDTSGNKNSIVFSISPSSINRIDQGFALIPHKGQ